MNQDQAASAPPDMDLTGKTLGDFTIQRCLGRGGMGQVYLAEQISLKRAVALKTLRPDLAANQQSLQRFEAEAKAVARATHANIVQIYVIDKAQVDGQTIHYLALEYVDGRNLREYLEKKGTPDAPTGLNIMQQVASALQRAGELGIIHRDIKPENILITRQGDVKVADFGLSRCFSDPARPASVTQTGVTMGTPLYMAPEQVEQGPVDLRTDIYSFGVSCYHMFAGEPPFKGKSPFEVALQHVQNEPEPLQGIRPDLPAELCELIHKMMAKKPEDRPPTSREILRQLARISAGGLTHGAQPPTPGRKRLAGMLVVLLGLTLGLGGSYLWFAVAHPSRATEVPAVAPPPSAEREKELLELIQKEKAETSEEKRLTLLKHDLELGVLYFQQGRLDDANSFFTQLAENKDFAEVSQLGSAMVLAFQGDPEPSNQKFKAVLLAIDRRDASDRLRNVWLNNPAWRKMMALALHHNQVNAPGSFPPQLQPWLEPPRIKAKG